MVFGPASFADTPRRLADAPPVSFVPGCPTGICGFQRGRLAMTDNPGHRLPPHWWDGAADPTLPPLVFVAPGDRAHGPLRHVLSQSFAFGGSNAVLVFGGE